MEVRLHDSAGSEKRVQHSFLLCFAIPIEYVKICFNWGINTYPDLTTSGYPGTMFSQS